jgi:hypothetical protein
LSFSFHRGKHTSEFQVDHSFDDMGRRSCTYMFTLVDEAAFCAVATLDDDFSSTIQLLFVTTLGLSLRCCLDRGSGFFFENRHSVTV